MKRFPLFLVATGLLAGCATHAQQNEQAEPKVGNHEATHSFSIGMTREQVRVELTNSWHLMSASRPTTGWSKEVSPPADGRAVRFEHSHPDAKVESCDVYWIDHTDPPAMYYGIWLDYFYFDHKQKLIGFDRWVID